MDLQGARQRIAAGLRQAFPDLARTVEADETSLERVPAPFLRSTRLFIAEKSLPTRPLLIHVGLADSGRVYLLNERRDAFNQMVKADGAIIADPGHAAELARLFLHLTRPQDRRYLLVATVDALPWMPGSRPDERAAIVRPPTVTPRPTGHEVELYVVEDNALKRARVIVSRDGQADAREEVFAADLPLAAAL